MLTTPHSQSQMREVFELVGASASRGRLSAAVARGLTRFVGRQPGLTAMQQALALADELGMRSLVAHCHLGLGMLSLKMGRLEQARVELSTATELYHAMDMSFWLPEAEAALAQVEAL